MDYTTAQLENWNAAIGIMRRELNPAQFNAWFNKLKLHAITSDTLLCEAPDQFVIDNIGRRYMTMFYNCIGIAFGRHYEIVIALKADIARQMEQLSRTMLNKKYTFDNFVVGTSNSFAYAASVAVAEDPSDAYNPLFIYGGVGLGKTHLMNAIGNYITVKDPRRNVLFISSETFTNDFIDTLVKKKGTSDMRERLRNVDVLMVDDIQFLSKTVATQEEFFHTFNHLHTKGKQIILSSDRPPKEIPTIEERLRSRFEWGLTVDIRKPDFETRVAILRRKCIDEGIECDDEVLHFIAGRVESNIRELEGALNRLRAKNELIGGRINTQFAEETLEAILPPTAAREVNAQVILSTVAERYAVTREDILSKKRNREYALPRQITMYLLRDMTPLSTTAIGRELGNRDHTTVMHGCDRITQAMQKDPTFRKSIDELKDTIVNG
ncbi:MAG: chromosomal replication initiator protein DnaA [Christensenellales bacterium]|jgi:chromosomal replication initiator protein